MFIQAAPWYAHITNYLVTGEVPSEWKAQDKKQFFTKFMPTIGKSHFYSNIVMIK